MRVMQWLCSIYRWSGSFYISSHNIPFFSPLNSQLADVHSVLYQYCIILMSPVTVALNCSHFLPLYFTMAQQPILSQGRIIIEDSRSYSGTPHSIGFLCTTDQPDAETPTWQQTFMTTTEFAPGFRASVRPQTQALDRTATEIGSILILCTKNSPPNSWFCLQ